MARIQAAIALPGRQGSGQPVPFSGKKAVNSPFHNIHSVQLPTPRPHFAGCPARETSRGSGAASVARDPSTPNHHSPHACKLRIAAFPLFVSDSRPHGEKRTRTTWSRTLVTAAPDGAQHRNKGDSTVRLASPVPTPTQTDSNPPV